VTFASSSLIPAQRKIRKKATEFARPICLNLGRGKKKHEPCALGVSLSIVLAVGGKRDARAVGGALDKRTKVD